MSPKNKISPSLYASYFYSAFCHNKFAWYVIISCQINARRTKQKMTISFFFFSVH